MSLLQHIYQRLTWQSSEYSLFETVWPPPLPSPLQKSWSRPWRRKGNYRVIQAGVDQNSYDYLSKTKTDWLLHTVISTLIKKIKNKWTATKPFNEVCLGNILLFPWFDNKQKKTNKNGNRSIPRFLYTISTLSIIPFDVVSFLAV